MTIPETDDPANGYDALADEFEKRRSMSTIGATQVRRWAEGLPAGAAVLDLGCGTGVPISRTLVESRCQVSGVDASPRMATAFRRHLPGVPIAVEAVENSRFFDRSFDGIVAWGLIFLLPAAEQSALIARAATALRPGGSLLFTAPWQSCTWIDLLTQRPSRSLGAESYRRALNEAGLRLVAEFDDEGENHYFEAERLAGTEGAG